MGEQRVADPLIPSLPDRRNPERLCANPLSTCIERPLDAWTGDGDIPLPEDRLIHEAFPTRTGRHDLYAEAMRLVGARRSKGGLVALVNWLLAERERGGRDGG